MKQLLVVLAVLVGSLGLGSSVATASAPPAAWGRVSTGDHQLRQGCHSYPFRYRVDAPSDDWMAEVSLINPSGRSIASHTLTYNIDARSGVRNWRVCSTSTRVGVHVMTMKVTSFTSGDATEQREAPRRFRFTSVR